MTRRSPRNQEHLWRALGLTVQPRQALVVLRTVVSTADRRQTLSCGHVVPLPPCWAGRAPRERRCEECRQSELTPPTA